MRVERKMQGPGVVAAGIAMLRSVLSLIAQIPAAGPLVGTSPDQPIFVNVSPPGTSPVLAAILGAVVGGLLTLAGQFVAHKLAEQREAAKAKRDAEIQREVDVLTALERFTTAVSATTRSVANLWAQVALLRQHVLEGDEPADVRDILDNVIDLTSAYQDAKGPLLGHAAALAGALNGAEPDLMAEVQGMVHSFAGLDNAVGEIAEDVRDIEAYESALAAYGGVETAIATAPTLYFRRRANQPAAAQAGVRRL